MQCLCHFIYIHAIITMCHRGVQQGCNSRVPWYISIVLHNGGRRLHCIVLRSLRVRSKYASHARALEYRPLNYALIFKLQIQFSFFFGTKKLIELPNILFMCEKLFLERIINGHP